MVIRKDHAKVLLTLWKDGESLLKDMENYLWHLELAGLVRPTGVGVYDLTYAGRMVSEVLNEMISEGIIDQPDNWDSSFRWLGSEIISMIRYSKQARMITKQEISEELEKRGFSSEGKLTPYAQVIDEAYEETHPRLIINSKLAEILKKIPEGPGKSSVIKQESDDITELESMRLIAFSIPKSDIYALTGLGQQLKLALIKGLIVTDELILDELMLDTVAKAYSGKKLTEFEKTSLMERGIMGFSGELLPAADHLYLAWRLFREGPYKATPSFQITEEEIKLLKTIKKLWDINKTNPDILPTSKEIKKRMEEDWNYKDYSPTLALMNLEGFGLITSKGDRSKKQLIYELTHHGEEVLENIPNNKGVSSISVKSITMTKKEFAAPNLDWYNKAVEEGLVSNSAPTKLGKLFARLAVETKRLPLLTKPEANALKKVPFGRGIFMDKNFTEEEKRALEMLESKNLVEILPTNLVVLTKAGEYMKQAVMGVPAGIGTPVTPTVIRLLLAIRKVGGLHVKENKIRIKPDNWKMIEEEVGVDPATFNDALLLAKNCKYLGKDSLTQAGNSLLEAVDELAKTEYTWLN